MHIAILDTDLPVPAVYQTRGLYSTQFTKLIRAATTRLGPRYLTTDNGEYIWTFTHTSSYDVVGGMLPPEDRLRTAPNPPQNGHEQELRNRDIIDGILITGSACSAYDKDALPWIGKLEEFIRRVWAMFPLVKIFGSCFGHQIIAQALLSRIVSGFPRSTLPSEVSPPSFELEDNDKRVRVERCPSGYEVGIVPITLDQTFNRLFPYIARALRGRRQFRLQLVHGDRVVPISSVNKDMANSTLNPNEIKLPHPWVNLGHTPRCPIQGLLYPGRVLTFQGHFEFDAFVNCESIREFGRRFGWDPAVIEDYVKQIEISAACAEGREDEDDSKLAAEALVLFLAGKEHVFY